MKTHRILLTGLLFLAQTASAGLHVHEWGTFTSLIGSNGLTQNGMYHEDEKLPEFVHVFGEVLETGFFKALIASNSRRECDPGDKGCVPRPTIEANFISQKMETPVIYFYSDREQQVEVNVKFPEGAVTETYPAPIATYPKPEDAPMLENGNTTFRVTVKKPGAKAELPFVEPNNIYGHARNVNSNIVTAGNETEKFIFYRGLGRFQPKLKIHSRDGGLYIYPTKAYGAQAAMLVDVDEHGHSQMVDFGNQAMVSVSSELIAQLQNHRNPTNTNVLSGEALRLTLQRHLEEAGLYADEAKAMIDTWAHGYFKVPGLRLLYILPNNEVKEVLPLTVIPKPDKLERVFVGRIEVLLDTEEQKILNEVYQQKAQFSVQSLGRFAESKLRRVYEVFKDKSGDTEPAMDKVFLDLIKTAANM